MGEENALRILNKLGLNLSKIRDPIKDLNKLIPELEDQMKDILIEEDHRLIDNFEFKPLNEIVNECLNDPRFKNK